jgi:hypothetical protein
MSDVVIPGNPDVYPLRADPDLVNHLGFILAEEEALKKRFTGLKVATRPGYQGTTDVGVWFRYPEGERQLAYPFITIDLLTVEPDYELFTSTFIQDPTDLYQPSFSPTLPPLPPGNPRGYEIREYLPMRLVWQVSTFCRSALHDRYLTSIFMTDVLPYRPFFIESIDGVARRTDRIGFQAADTLETTESGTKRIFRKIYTISMLTEVPQNSFATSGDYSQFLALRALIPVTDLAKFDTYFKTILDGHADPIDEFTAQERETAGEYFHVAHEGRMVPPAT